MVFNWTESNIEKLKTMWLKGMSARQIGDELGGISRNSVIGKAHRLGLSTQKDKKLYKGSKNSELLSEKKIGKTLHKTLYFTPQSTVSTERLCQWPFGDPGDQDFRFCHKKASAGRPYCEEHCKIAYRQNCSVE